MVAPLAGAWIEIELNITFDISDTLVAPLAGAWIEISKNLVFLIRQLSVAPLAGAWIEIYASAAVLGSRLMSLPSRERGLKLLFGEWAKLEKGCRSPRGSVD